MTNTKEKNRAQKEKKQCSEWGCNLVKVTEERLMEEVTFEKELRPARVLTMQIFGQKTC